MVLWDSKVLYVFHMSAAGNNEGGVLENKNSFMSDRMVQYQAGVGYQMGKVAIFKGTAVVMAYMKIRRKCAISTIITSWAYET